MNNRLKLVTFMYKERSVIVKYTYGKQSNKVN